MLAHMNQMTFISVHPQQTREMICGVLYKGALVYSKENERTTANAKMWINLTSKMLS